MPVNSPLITPDANSANKSFDPFQRRKIGSLRENNKLFKILQQFENASNEAGKVSDTCSDSDRLNFTESAPASLNFSDVAVKNGFLKLNQAINNQTQHIRRHSEGEPSFGIKMPYKWSKTSPGQNQGKAFDNLDKSSFFQRKKPSVGVQKDNYSRLKLLSANTPIPLLQANAMYKTPESPNSEKSIQALNVPRIQNNSKAIVEADAVDDIPPPIPRRGLSIPISTILQAPETSAKKLSPSSPQKSPSSPKNFIKHDSVKRAIQMYEGLTDKGIKIPKANRKGCNYPKVVPKKDPGSAADTNNRRGVTRKSSRKNSFRLSKNLSSNKEESKKQNAPLQKNTHADKYQHSKDDSGIGFSDTEDSRRDSGSIYQTLGNGPIAKNQHDTYDRLNRIHDMVHRIHKGQSSSCAACKAIPTSAFHLPQMPTPSLLQVKCNELSPHHHPPCICFACQHSVFSCSQDFVSRNTAMELTLENLNLADDQENLYYNVCCLNGPSCWRQSRRRPVCEQNGRLCVVNCDMEKKNMNCKFYDKLSECHSANEKQFTLLRDHQVSKNISGDSCDSDEGWVDVTDSEDEKLLSMCNSSHSTNHYGSSNTLMETSSSRTTNSGTPQKYSSFNLKKSDELYSKVGFNDMSRSASSEHLYETIADIEAQCNNYDLTKDSPVNAQPTADNDPDSGEWSTESSSSPTPGETSTHLAVEGKCSNTSESSTSRFTVNSDVITLQKKTFIKSVLGKKTVNPKKRRMSNFFVPWLVSNHEYGASRSPKSSLKKQSKRNIKSDSSLSMTKRTFSKSVRSQSIPSCSTSANLSCAKAVFSSTEILDRCKSDTKELEQKDKHSESSFRLCVSPNQSISQRGSIASSTYLRPDELQTSSPFRSRTPASIEEAVDVSVEKIFRRSASGESMHSYFVFRPIKEEEVPLYQFYERNIKERVALCRSPQSLSPVMWSSNSDFLQDCSGHKSTFLKPQLSVVEQLSPDAKDIKMLWCELPEVKESGILERISAQELKLQEAAFEFIQSQASYIRSLKVLYEHFIQAPEFVDTQSSCCVLSKHEHDVLFSDIIGVKEVSEGLMAELTTRWSEGILIPDICDIIHCHATLPSFSVYVKYCSNRVYQEKTLKELKETRLCFLEVLRKLESNPVCQGLSLESFLFLPMQHIARLPLLLDSIFRWLGSDSPSFNICKMALESVHKIFMECNDGARRMERLEEMFILNKQLEFKECKVIPLISASRWLLKRGELIKLEFDKKTFGRSSRCVRIPIYVFLFNDLIVITKRKSEDSYTVLDYCLRDKAQAMAVEAKDLQQPDLVPSSCRYLMYLTLFSNHQGSAVDMIFNCTLLSERTRWIEAIHPVSQKKTTEVWEYDCPQVQCVRSYIAQQPDELSLQESDVVTISRKMNDGWYEGRRLRDGLQGWFPASYTMDIPCSRARASNLHQCYRLLMLSQKHESKI